MVTINALAGGPICSTLKVKGFEKRRSITILVNTGATTSFVDSEVVLDSKSYTHETNPIRV